MSDARETYRVLDLALRTGEILLSSGAGAADVTATMRAISEHYGLRQVDVDVTFTALRMGHQYDPEEPPVLLSRSVVQRDLDYDDLTRVQLLVDDVLHDRVDVAEARKQIAWLNSTDHYLPGWASAPTAGVVGGAIGVLLGGGVLVATVAALAGVLVTLLMRFLNQGRWPMFYQQAAGGFLATVLALATTAAAARVDVAVNTSLVISANVVLLLAGIGFLGAVQDALTGFYLTSAARILEALLATAGLIAGVSAGLALAPTMGVSLLGFRPGEIVPSPPAVSLVAAIVPACAFAVTCYAPLRSLAAVAASTGVGLLVFTAVNDPSNSEPWAATLAAIMIGLVSYSVAGRVRVPPLVVVVPALVPLLPGLTVFRGLSYMADGDTLGILQLSAAAATAIALSAGVILGEYVAQPLKRNARRLEARVAGPRLVGVMHGQGPQD